MKCQNLFSGKNYKKKLIFFPAFLAFKKLCQEKMALIFYVGSEGPDNFVVCFLQLSM